MLKGSVTLFDVNLNVPFDLNQIFLV